MTATTGAVMVLAMFPADSAGRSRSFSSGVRINKNRAGEQFAEVGPISSSPYNSRRVSSDTVSTDHFECVRALWNSVLRALTSMLTELQIHLLDPDDFRNIMPQHVLNTVL